MSAAIEVDRLRKTFGETVAVEEVSFSVPTGTVLGLLGPNGAGKTTTVKCLTTLLRMDGGRASVAGHDVTADGAGVRGSIAVTGQFAAVDEAFTGRENLILFGRLLRLRRTEAKARAAELLSFFDLDEAADRPVKTYSGGMRKRLDLAVSLVVPKPVLFLDEPTTGLDPRSRQDLLDTVRRLAREGTTVLLTTQYLQDADEVADRIVVITRGRVIAEGTADELKDQVGGATCEVHVADEKTRKAAADVLSVHLPGVGLVGGTIIVPAAGPDALVETVRRLDAAGIRADDISLRRPTLDDVFFALTGRADEAEHAEPVLAEVAS
jgi:ABC-2 type transport system ATP-binding protein